MIVKKQDQRFRGGAAAVLGAMFLLSFLLSPAPRAQAQQFDAPFLSLEGLGEFDHAKQVMRMWVDQFVKRVEEAKSSDL